MFGFGLFGKEKEEVTTMAMKRRYTYPAKRRYQTGKTRLGADRNRHALKPGKKRSASGKVYYERRRNRTDKSFWA